jgi:hypothetical protein
MTENMWDFPKLEFELYPYPSGILTRSLLGTVQTT